MDFSLIIIGLFISGVFALLSLILGIIALANGKNKNAIGWGAGFVIAIVLTIFSGVQLANHVKERIVENLDWMTKNGIANNPNRDDTRDILAKRQRQEWLDTLQLYINEKYEGSVPADFYVNKEPGAFVGKPIIVPFLYPYLIRYNPATFTGDIILPTSDSIFVKNVSQLAFDSNFVIIKVDNSLSPEALKENHAETEYVLFDLRTRNFEPAANKAKLDDLAKRIGYTGSVDLTNLSYDYQGWVE